MKSALSVTFRWYYQTSNFRQYVQNSLFFLISIDCWICDSNHDQILDIPLGDLEPLAKDCTEVLVWHTKTVSEKTPKVRLTEHLDTNLKNLVDNIVFKGMDTYDKKQSKGELKVCMDAARCDKYSNL